MVAVLLFLTLLLLTSDHEAVPVKEFVRHVAEMHQSHGFSREFEVLGVASPHGGVETVGTLGTVGTVGKCLALPLKNQCACRGVAGQSSCPVVTLDL